MEDVVKKVEDLQRYKGGCFIFSTFSLITGG
jgi:hypothetical protein